MKKSIKVLIITFMAVIGFLCIGMVVFYFMPSERDYQTFEKMRAYQISQFEKYGLSERGINRFFDNYSIELPFVYAYMFKSGSLSLFLKSYESDKIETATINQLEIGKDTGNFFDFTFMIRPRPELEAPFFHGDALKPLPGVQGALYMDFYSFADKDLSQFFGESVGKLSEALELAKPYWKTEGFGELTAHLDPYKSQWRLEMVAPEKASQEDLAVYYETVMKCYRLYVEAYMSALESCESTGDRKVLQMNQEGIKDFVSILYKEDVAVKMGKMIFPEEDFDRYFLEGFWGVSLEKRGKS